MRKPEQSPAQPQPQISRLSMLNSCGMVQAADVAADQGTWGRYPGVGSCVSASEEKVVQTSHVITTKSFKEDVISILILWIRKQRLKKRE